MYRHLINGVLMEGTGGALTVYNPADGALLAEFAAAGQEQAQAALCAAEAAFPVWSALSLRERETHIRSFIRVLRENKTKVVDLLIQETGKPASGADYDFEMLPDCLDFFIEQAKRLSGALLPDLGGGHANLIIHKPLGVVAGYLAWNFPLLNLAYKLGPVLASGCTCVLKPSSYTPLASLLVGELALAAGIPAGVINILAAPGAEISRSISASTIPKMLTLIGSSETGRDIIRHSASSVKHFSLELGGNAPAVVCKSADVAHAAACICDGKFGNAGQVCVAPNRVFVHREMLEPFLTQVRAFVGRITLGAGNDPADVLMGPMVSPSACDRMAALVHDALDKGAMLVAGGARVDRPGYFFQPTVLRGVTRDMLVYKEEIFGPILPIITYGDEDDLAALANDTAHGLAAYLYASDLSSVTTLARAIDAGSVCVNEPYYNYNLPHGGCKESGIGKDCSVYSLEEYVTLQRISIRL